MNSNLLILILPLTCLWDFYLGEGGSGIRIFDVAAIAFYIWASMLKLASVSYRFQTARADLLKKSSTLVLFCFIYGLIGMITGNADLLRPVMGVWLGVLIFFSIVVNGALRIEKVFWIIDFCLLVLSFAIITQFLIFHIFGYLLNFQAVIGGEPRIFSSVFRPSGLFLEPSSHSITAFMLIALRLHYKTLIDAVYLISIIGMIISFSVLGVLLAILLILYFSRSIKLSIVICSILPFGGVLNVNEIEVIQHLIDRVLNLSEDNSTITRYSSILDGRTMDAQSLLGVGLTNNYHTFGTSGLAFLLSGFGILGTIFFILLIYSIFNSVSNSRILLNPWKFMFSFGIVLLAAPIWTTMFMWVWLALLIKFSAFDRGKMQIFIQS